MLYKSHIFHRANLLNTEKIYLDSEITLKNMPHYVVSYERSFTKSLCRPSAFKQREYVTASICKPHNFRRADLLNTEIIITTFPKPLIKLARNVGTFERRFSRYWFKHICVELEAYVSTVIMGNINLPKPYQSFRFI